MPRFILTIVALSAILAFKGCGCSDSTNTGGSGDDGSPVPFENYVHQCAFTVMFPETAVYRDDAAWTQLWAENCGAFELPVIDFESEMIVGVYYGGSSYSGCQNWAEVIESITATEEEIRVELIELDDDQLGHCDGMVYPMQLVKIAKSDLPVVFTGVLPE